MLFLFIIKEVMKIKKLIRNAIVVFSVDLVIFASVLMNRPLVEKPFMKNISFSEC